jgi:hypothetical protein
MAIAEHNTAFPAATDNKKSTLFARRCQCYILREGQKYLCCKQAQLEMHVFKWGTHTHTQNLYFAWPIDSFFVFVCLPTQTEIARVLSYKHKTK